jgi:hypothetical protein
MVRMDKYYFNADLFRNLKTVLDTTILRLAKSAGVPAQSWYRWRAQGDIPINALISMCDEYQIPISYFICTEANPSVAVGRRHYSRTEGGYESPVFYNKVWGDEVTVSCGRSVLELCKLCCFSTTTFYCNFRQKDGVSDSIFMGQWIDFCNACKVYPLDFFSGKHLDVPVLPGYARVSVSREDREAATFKRNKEIAAQNMRLQNQLNKKNRALSEKEELIARLTEKVEEQRRMIDLLHRLVPDEGVG